MTDAYVELLTSRDGSHTQSDPRSRDLGDVGAFQTRAIWRRLGIARHMVVTVRNSSPNKRDVIAMEVQMEPVG